jgi:predicted O-methyltransferase YrrM
MPSIIVPLKRLPLKLYNSMYMRIWPASQSESSSPELREIEEQAAKNPSDISDHLSRMFSEVVAAKPRLIVELGVRGGQSRAIMERAARISNSSLVSVDLNDCSAACGTSPLWHFVKSDDIKFAATFRDWCLQRSIEPSIDVLFIDSSHLYEHTVQEINSWFPFLSPRCTVLFHDTNMRFLYRRLNGTIGHAWNNKRGVIRAIEERLGARFDERITFATCIGEWMIRHWDHCNGFTILSRRSTAQSN